MCKFIVILYLLFIIYDEINASEDETQDNGLLQRSLEHLLDNRTISEIQVNSANELLVRLLGDDSSKFSIYVNESLLHGGKDTFKLTKNPKGIIEITGSSGFAAAWGLNYYLKNFCNVHISWDGTQLKLPDILPDVDLIVISNDRFRYYQNVCTSGYSYTWWGWSQWEEHIDWMALNGINLALAFTAQEAIWQRVYLEYNFTVEDINEHFAGPAFLPWSRMGNIRGWGGPLTSSWHHSTIELQHKILNRMRSLGMTPVLPAFAGQVPRAAKKYFPNSLMNKVANWNNFQDEFCCPYMLEPTDPLFQMLGITFLKKYIEEFGTDHIYNCDAFNEIVPSNTSLEYLKDTGKAIFETIIAVDSLAVWLLQGWQFFHDIEYWTKSRARAFLTSVPIGRMIVLDLQAEQFPQYERLDFYFGQTFIWCMLHNFGGTLGMFGSAGIINQRIFDARNSNGSTMVGIGITPEGINQNYVIYELMLEMGYRQKPADLKLWFRNYATRRYGALNDYTVDAWQKLGKSIYNFAGPQKIRGHYVVTRRPSLKIEVWFWYDTEILLEAWDKMLLGRHARNNSILYKHDLVDITRQVLQVKGDKIYLKIVKAYNTQNSRDLKYWSNKLLELFNDLECILASGSNFLLGIWLENAKSAGTTKIEKENFEYNARNQITLWGPNGEIRDYANKQWAGVVKDYFMPRWMIFVEMLNDALNVRTVFNQTVCDDKIFKYVEQPFTFSNKYYPTSPTGDVIDISLKIHSKWRYS